MSTQLITVASVASMHSFTSASEQTVEAAANGNILLFLRDNGCSPLGSFCSFVELYRNSMPVQYTVIEVYHSLFNVTLWKRRHAAASA